MFTIFMGRFLLTADTPLSQVKLGELPGWLARKSKNPIDWGRACSRAYWRWNHKYFQPKYCGLTPLIQLGAGMMLFFYATNYGKFSEFEIIIMTMK